MNKVIDNKGVVKMELTDENGKTYILVRYDKIDDDNKQFMDAPLYAVLMKKKVVKTDE